MKHGDPPYAEHSSAAVSGACACTYRHFKADFPAHPPVSSAGSSTVPPREQLPCGAPSRPLSAARRVRLARAWAPMVPLDPAFQRPPCQSGCGREKPRRPVPGPSGRGRSVGGRVGGQAAGRAAGEGVGGLRQTPLVLRRCHHFKRLLFGASSEKARGDQGVAGCSAVGGCAGATGAEALGVQT
jgi:hypothetical protein